MMFNVLAMNQVRHELDSAHQYLGMAMQFEIQGLRHVADVFYQHSAEERAHGLRFVKYLMDNGLWTQLPTVNLIYPPTPDVSYALHTIDAHEKLVTSQIHKLAEVASNHVQRNLIQWFVREQVEEEELTTKLLAGWAETNGDEQAFDQWVSDNVEHHVAPSAPQVAGGGLA